MFASWIVDLMDLITWRMVRESGDGIISADLVDVRRIERKCRRTSGGEDPVINAND